MKTESELILARVGVFREDETQSLRHNLPTLQAQHGANRKADCGISKMVFETMRKFVPVGSGELCSD